MTSLMLALLTAYPVLAADSPAAGAPPATARVTRDLDNLWNLAGEVRLPAQITRQQWMAAVLRRNPDAFVQGNINRLRRDVLLELPSLEEAAAEDANKAQGLIAQHQIALDQGLPADRLPPPPRAAQVPVAPASAAVPAAPMPAPASAAAPSPAPTPAGVASGAAGQPPLVAASQATPASSPAAEPSPTAPGSRSTASAPASAPTDTVPARPDTGSRRWLPYGLALTLLAAAGWAVWRTRRDPKRGDFLESISSFLETVVLARKSKPAVVNVSQAGAEMARNVEQLKSTGTLVRSGAAAAQGPATLQQQEARIKLEIARTQIELGRLDAARAMLQASANEGDPDTQLQAQTLLGTLKPA